MRSESDRIPVTVRIPPETMTKARRALLNGESFNALVVEAIEHEVAHRQSMGAPIASSALRARIANRHGPSEGSAALVRGLRDGSARHDG